MREVKRSRQPTVSGWYSVVGIDKPLLRYDREENRCPRGDGTIRRIVQSGALDVLLPGVPALIRARRSHKSPVLVAAGC